MSPSDTRVNLSTLRKDIDAIDSQIIDLLIQRLGIVHQVGRLKSREATQAFTRPAREALMVKNLIAQATPHYHPETIIRLWRTIITASLYTEKSFHLAVEACSDFMDNYWLGREYFGNFVPTSLHSDVSSVVRHIQNDTSVIGIVSSDGSWWQHLSSGTAAPYGIQVFACIPFIHIQESPKTSTALALAQIIPEETGDDISLISARIQNISAEQHLREVFEKHNVSIISSQKKDDLLLLTLNRYIFGTEHPIFRHVQEITSSTVKQLLPMGCYARPVDV